MHICGRHVDGERQAQRINQQMPFAPFDMLVRVVADIGAIGLMIKGFRKRAKERAMGQQAS